MRFEHPEHPGRSVRLAYCLNLYPAEDVTGLRAGLEAIARPLRERLMGDSGPPVPAGERFGVGLWLPAAVALELADPGGRDELAALARDLDLWGLDPFTLNAFPYGGFHSPGLKAGVFRPTWMEPERLAFTVAVARCAVRLAGAPTPGRHLSISTHTGGFGTDVASDAERAACIENLALAVAELARLEAGTGWRIVLALEAEPRASAGTTAELRAFRARARDLGAGVVARALAVVPERGAELLDRHLGTCLDACHAAVEFEPAAEALANATDGAPLGKLQFSSALRLAAPAATLGAHADLLAMALAMAEPVYLHQVTGRGPAGLVRATDLPEVAAALGSPGTAAAWLACDEWRCHFHVPVDLEHVAGAGPGAGAGRLGTTRAEADSLLAIALERPEAWGTDELHLEIETYTWSVLPEGARSPGNDPDSLPGDPGGDLVGGLQREYEHVLDRLSEAGWRRAGESPDPR